jgi:hypothetical protein
MPPVLEQAGGLGSKLIQAGGLNTSGGSMTLFSLAANFSALVRCQVMIVDALTRKSIAAPKPRIFNLVPFRLLAAVLGPFDVGRPPQDAGLFLSR